jgi:hypothetical protein
VAFVHAARHRTSPVPAIQAAGATTRATAAALGSILAKRGGLPEASAPRRLELVLEAFVLPLQAVAFALGLATRALRSRELIAQAPVLAAQALKLPVPITRPAARRIIRHAEVMPDFCLPYKLSRSATG